MKRQRYPFFLVLIFSVSFSVPLLAEKGNLHSFTSIYEPSGVVHLADGHIMVIEDEPDTPLWILRPYWQGTQLKLKVHLKFFLSTPHDDLEAIATIAKGRENEIFLMCSHSRTAKGKRKEEREVLLRLIVKEDGFNEQSTNQLSSHILDRLARFTNNPRDNKTDINIEGMSLSPDGEHLLLGLRQPVDDDNGIVLQLNNPRQVLSGSGRAESSDKLFSLPTGGGIRALHYDRWRDNYILASEKEVGGKKQSALWLWQGHGDQISPIHIPGIPQLDNIEGVTLIRWQNRSYLLVVCDDGNRRKKKGAHYFFYEY